MRDETIVLSIYLLDILDFQRVLPFFNLIPYPMSSRHSLLVLAYTVLSIIKFQEHAEPLFPFWEIFIILSEI